MINISLQLSPKEAKTLYSIIQTSIYYGDLNEQDREFMDKFTEELSKISEVL